MAQPNTITLLGWRGYRPLIKELKKVTPLDEDASWWLEDEYSEEDFRQIEPNVDDRCQNADDVKAKFVKEWNTATTIDFVVVDREYRDHTDYQGKLIALGDLGIYPEKVLHSALPLLAARHYYTVANQFALLPVRFGTNGVVCNQSAINILRGTVITREEVGKLENFDLDALQKESNAGRLDSKLQFWRWKWSVPINKILEKASRNSKTAGGHTEFKDAILKVFECELDDWEAMTTKLKDSRPVVILGPSEMLAAPINGAAGRQVVDWFLVKGAGLLWVESIACNSLMVGYDGDKDAVKARRRNWLVGTALRLMANPWDALRAKDGEYWGYPVLGWSACCRDKEKRCKAIKTMETIAGPEKVKLLTREDPGEWMSNFLMDAGLSLRESPRTVRHEMQAIAS